MKPALLLVLAASFCAACLLSACGGSIPDRFVVERDVDEFQYRRYQRVLDVEFPVEGNPAEGHTATYVVRDQSDDVRFTSVFVTVYENSGGLSAEIKRSLESLGTYDVDVDELSGENVFILDGGGDVWALWVSGRYVIKLGAPDDEEVPEAMADLYTGLYPSDLDEHGRAREGTASVGRARDVGEEEEDDRDLPAHLREGAPQ